MISTHCHQVPSHCLAATTANCYCSCDGCRNARNDPAKARLPLTLEEEVKELRAAVTALQQRGTEQFTLARRSAFETAANMCDAAALEYCCDPEMMKLADQLREFAKK